MFKKAVTAAFLALPLAFAFQGANAQATGEYIDEAAAADHALAAEFKRVTKPVSAHASWIASFGTTTPATLETLDGRSYSVYQGCKPHDCTTENYVIMYNLETKTIVAGAFVQNSYDSDNLVESKITWLAKTSADSARAIGKYLY